jgi:hypothetical protein
MVVARKSLSLPVWRSRNQPELVDELGIWDQVV